MDYILSAENICKKYSGKTILRNASIHVIGKLNDQKCKVGVVINDSALFVNMNATDNMKGPAYLLGIRVPEKIEQTLKTVGLEHNS